MPDPAPLLPVMLRLEGRACVVLGGGKVALRRAKSLLECGAQVTVIAPVTDAAFGDLRENRRLTLKSRPYEPGDLHGAFLAVLATDAPEVQREAAKEAEAEGVLVNRADAEGGGDVEVCAHGRKGTLTVAVHTGGASAKAAAMIRDEVMGNLDPKWSDMLATLAAMRKQIQEEMPPGEAREAKLRQLAEELFR